jgi:hypothetical protein
MAFGREHEPVLKDLRVLLERRSGRRLAGHVTAPPGSPQITARTADPGARETQRYPEPATSPSQPSPGGLAAAHEDEAAAPGTPDGPLPPATKHSRPGARTLVVAVDSVPDTPEWLSFAGPTTLELLASPSTDTVPPDPTMMASPQGTGQATDW